MSNFNTRSISFRLNALFVLIVTVLLLISGGMNYLQARKELNTNLESQVKAAEGRLQANLSLPLWNADKPVMLDMLKAELGSSYVSAIGVRTPKDWTIFVGRDKDGKPVEVTEEPKTGSLLSVLGDVIYKEGDKSQAIGKYTLIYSRAEVDSALNAALLRLILQVIVLDVALVFALSSALRVLVIWPLRRVSDALRNIAEGEADLTRRLDERSGDEFADVARGFNTFVGRIQTVIRDVEKGVGEQLSAARELTQAADRVHASSRTQTDTVQSTAAAIEEMSVSVSNIADSTRGVEDETRQAANTASSGAQVAERAASEIRQIAESITQVSETVSVLAKRSAEIGSIVNVIKEIADQTNLLALNAAIEAARAGEQGRGFAVVADEVRKLAERTSQATQEINSKIAAVQSDTSQAVVGISEANRKVENGVKSTQTVSEALREIEGQSRATVGHIGTIAAAVSEQSSASQDVARNIERIANISEENEAVAQATNDISAQLADTARRLDEMLKRFTV